MYLVKKVTAKRHKATMEPGMGRRYRNETNKKYGNILCSECGKPLKSGRKCKKTTQVRNAPKGRGGPPVVVEVRTGAESAYPILTKIVRTTGGYSEKTVVKSGDVSNIRAMWENK